MAQALGPKDKPTGPKITPTNPLQLLEDSRRLTFNLKLINKINQLIKSLKM